MSEDMTIDAQELDDDEFLDIVTVQLQDLKKLLQSGAFRDSKTIIAVQHVIAAYNL